MFLFTQLLRYVTDTRKERLANLPDISPSLPENMRNWHEYSDWVPIAVLVMFLLMDRGRKL